MIAALASLAAPNQPAYAKIASLAQTLAADVAPLVALPTSGASVAPSGSPSPAPTASPTPQPRYRGGPLRFSISGSVGLGTQSTSTSSTATDLFGNPISQSISQTQETVGMLAEVTQRSGSSTVDLRVPLGLSNTVGSQWGAGQLTYATPHYMLGYGAQMLNLFGQLTLGETLNGFFMTVPSGNGDLTSIEGSALGVQDETVHLVGVRGRRMVHHALVEYGVFHNIAAPQTGTATTLMGGIATNQGKSTIVLEAAAQDRQTPTGPVQGIALQGRLDLGTTSTAGSLTIRSVPERFLAYGLGEVYGDQYVDAGVHHYSGKHGDSIDVSEEQTSYSGSITSTRRTLATLSGPLGRAAYSINLQDQFTGGTQPEMWTGGIATQLAVPLGSAALNLGSTLERETQQDQETIGTFNWNAQFQKNFRNLAIDVGLQRERVSSGSLGISRLSTMTASATKSFGKSSIGYMYAYTRTQSPTSDATQITPQLLVSRQLSPVLAVQINYGTQRLTDTLNPASDGRSKIFGLQVNAPFTFGNGSVQGRIDPRLPATIQGRVLTDMGQTAAFSGYSANGLGNIVVIMDGTQLQRTDLNGNFQFSFVAPGQHQIRIETASLPRGLTVDQPVLTITVQGGQLAQASFLVGNFGGVVGHVYGTDADGARVPLQNVMLRIDGAGYSQTDQDGVYGFGRLQAGEHKVSVILASVPAFANFSPQDLTHTVSVENGQIASLDFISQPLGSIEGKVVYGSDVPAPLIPGGGVLNAYVVAEPGEHAAIVNDDGSYIIDNMPPGTYTVSVDPETVADGLGQTSPDLNVNVGPQEHYQGAAFTIARKIKKVVFSFFSGGSAQTAQPTISISEKALPPDAAAYVSVQDADAAQSARLNAFATSTALVYDKSRKAWTGTLVVPSKTKAGTYPVSVQLTHGAQPLPVSLVVDPSMPLVLARVSPANPKPTEIATVHARFLVDVHTGDRIRWDDGQVTTLGKPLTGRLFVFTIHISLRPLSGTLLTHRASVPIRIL